MVDKELLEAIRGVVREEVVEAEQRTTKTRRGRGSRHPAEVRPSGRRNPGHPREAGPRFRVDELEDEMKFLKSIVRQMSEDLQKLKKAN